MPLLPAEVNAVKRYLGYDLGGTSALDRSLEQLDADGETSVKGVLAELAGIDTSITAARGRLKAEAVGDLKLNRGEVSALRRERSTVCQDLARLLGVCPPSLGNGQVIV